MNMIPHFTAAEKTIHYQEDRRFYVKLKPYMLFIMGIVLIGSIAIAWMQYLFIGLPPDPSLSFSAVVAATEPSGFPMWINISHWVNFFFLVLIIRSGLSILVDHPRLYWNDGCGPETEWIRFTPKKIPKDKTWTAKEDSRYISPVAGLPGYRHTVGIARSWHFITVPFFIINGIIFIFLLIYTNQWKRLVPTSFQIIPDSWNVFVHYATFNMPVEPNGFYHFNALQQLSYFAVVFIMAPLAMLTGLAMSPAIDSRFNWYPKLFFNRQSARSFHFLIMIAYVIFLIVHVALVALTGLTKNMNHILFNKNNDTNLTGLWIGIIIVLFVIGFNMLAHWLSWRKQRSIQYLEKKINQSLWSATINKFKPKVFYTKKDISPYFWPNGKMPDSKEWKDLADNKKIKMLLQCPMPQMDFDIITLGHGSGGVLTHNLLNSGVFDILKNDYLDQHHDGAFLNVKSSIAFTTDSFVVTPIFFPGGNIGDLAVNGTINDLAMCGAVPKYLSLSFIIEEGLTLKEFWEILVAIKFACEGANVKVVTGDTKVVEKGKGDKIFINTSGIGELHPKAKISSGNVTASDNVIISGNVATHGIAIMSVREGLVFETDLESDTCNLSTDVKMLLDEFGEDIHFMRDPTRGGVATVFNELAKDSGLGIDITQNKIPLSEQVEGACEMLGLDPLYVANEGIFICVVKAEIAEDLLSALKKSGHGKNAAIIGTVTYEHPKQVILTSSIGGRRMLNMLTGEQLPRIC